MRRLLLSPLVLLLAGCGAAASSRPVARPAPVAARTVTVPKPKAAASRDRVIAARNGQMEHLAVRLEITQLERSGTTTSLGLRLVNKGGLDLDVKNAFDDGVTQPIRGSRSRANGYSIDGIYLIDRERGMKYLVARDTDGRCICDAGLADTSLAYGSVPLSATFGAPPPDVTAVDVVVPHFGTFANVPLG